MRFTEFFFFVQTELQGGNHHIVRFSDLMISQAVGKLKKNIQNKDIAPTNACLIARNAIFRFSFSSWNLICSVKVS